MIYSLYVHIPFCQRRCHYCDFNTYVNQDLFMAAYVDALCKELRIVSKGVDQSRVHSIYLGGGTPSLISIPLYEKLLDTIWTHFSLTDHCEISLEANPGTLSPTYLKKLHSLGFNRLSLGVQSTDSFDLIRLDRIHTIDDVLSGFYEARTAGFTNINFDLIYGLPWQNLASWEKSLSRAINLQPEHFSLYSLIIEPGTVLFNWHQRGLIAAQNQDLEGDMFETAMVLLEETGYAHYEISNWAKIDSEADYRCRHNLQYWLNQPYLGIGAGAHGYADGIRTVNIPTISGYIDRLNQKIDHISPFPTSPATISTLKVDEKTRMEDFMMLGLRLVKEGVSADEFETRYGHNLMSIFGKEITHLQEKGLIAWSEGEETRLCLTKRGVMVANHVFMEFV